MAEPSVGDVICSSGWIRRRGSMQLDDVATLPSPDAYPSGEGERPSQPEATA